MEWWGDRYDVITIFIGDECLRKISHLRVFVVGAGTISWELLMNYAMLGIGTVKILETKEGERIVVTGPNLLETLTSIDNFCSVKSI